MNKIGDRLRQLRLSKKLSQEQLSKILNIGRTTYVSYESGGSKPTRKLQELAAFHGVTVDYILNGKEAEQNICLQGKLKEFADLFDKLSNEDQEILIYIAKLMAGRES